MYHFTVTTALHTFKLIPGAWAWTGLVSAAPRVVLWLTGNQWGYSPCLAWSELKVHYQVCQWFAFYFLYSYRSNRSIQARVTSSTPMLSGRSRIRCTRAAQGDWCYETGGTILYFVTTQHEDCMWLTIKYLIQSESYQACWSAISRQLQWQHHNYRLPAASGYSTLTLDCTAGMADIVLR